MIKALAVAFVLNQPALPPYQIAGAYWTPPTSTAQYVIHGPVSQYGIAGPVAQTERAMFVIVAER